MERLSPDSSTHIVPDKDKKSKKRKHKHRNKSKHKRSKSSSLSEADNVSQRRKPNKKKHLPNHEQLDEDIFDIRPLSEYVEDKKELHKQIFSIVPKKEIKGMLPDLLKRMEYKELKRLCLEQLEVMSQKRLRHIIAGEEMLSSSSDESGLPANNAEEIIATDIQEVAEPDNINILQEMSISPNQEEIDALVEGPSNTPAHANTANQEEIDGLVEGPGNTPAHAYTANQEEMDALVVNTAIKTEEENQDTTAADGIDNDEDEALVVAEAELKELEFRARALKSLVRARETQQKPKPATQ